MNITRKQVLMTAMCRGQNEGQGGSFKKGMLLNPFDEKHDNQHSFYNAPFSHSNTSN